MLKQKYQMYGLVRDQDGNPKIDDPSTMHPIMIGLMTKAEREAAGVWDGDYARDADGIKKIEKQEDGTFVALDALRAVSEIFDLGPEANQTVLYAVIPRGDYAIGETIPADHLHTSE